MLYIAIPATKLMYIQKMRFFNANEIASTFFQSTKQVFVVICHFFENWILKGRGVGNINFCDKNYFLWLVSNCNVSNSAPLIFWTSRINPLYDMPPSIKFKYF